MHKSRLEGLDVARFLAFVGMVVVNFHVVMGGSSQSSTSILLLIEALQGKAAATFVVLAGIGLGLEYVKSKQSKVLIRSLKRAAFLLVVGLANVLVFEADILHYYAFYFLFGAFIVGLSSRKLIGLMIVCNVVFMTMLLRFDYEQGWDWGNLTYNGFWQLEGFIRNLFFNGWHPVFPWLSFLIFGLLLSKLNLREKSVQLKLLFSSVLIATLTQLLADYLGAQLVGVDQELADLVTTKPMPPMPLYILMGMSVATFIISGCLLVTNNLAKLKILAVVVPAGRQALTLYIAHIFVGMGVLEALGLLENQTSDTAFYAALIFCACSVFFAFCWSKQFRTGPIEWLMRKLTQ